MSFFLLLLTLPLLAQTKLERHVLEIQTPLTLSHPKGTDLRPRQLWRMADKKVRYVKSDDLGVIFDYTATHSPTGLRLGQKEDPPKKKNHLILSGCSFVYGEGVQDSETLPSKLSAVLPDWHVYNSGIIGGSPKEHLYFWRFFALNEFIKEKDGVFLWNHYFDHFERIAGTWRYLDWSVGDQPNWNYDENGHSFTYAGTQGDSPKWKWSQFVKKNGLSYLWLKATYFVLPFQLKDKIPLMIEFLSAIKKEYLRQFPSGRFIVTKSPLLPWVPEEMRGLEKEFVSSLRKNRIEVWDNDQLRLEFFRKDGNEGPYYIPRDGHPTEKHNQWYAEVLASEFKKLSTNRIPQN